MKTNVRKKWTALFLASMLAVSGVTLTACGGTESSNTEDSSSVESVQPQPKPTYAITATGTGTGGTITADKTTANWGDDVTFTITPDDGYVVREFTLNGKVIDLSTDTYTVYNVLREYEAEVSFVKAAISISFTGEGTEGLLPKSVEWGKTVGTLPSIAVLGKHFTGWQDADGKTITADTLVLSETDITLSPIYTEITDTEREALKPFSQTTSYFDQAATKYGVSWHTAIAPLAPCIQIVEGSVADFTNARVIECETAAWIPEYDYKPYGEMEHVIQGVVDSLKFATTYTVRFGDASADVWSDTYTFTTREELITDVKFIHIGDTQDTQAPPAEGYAAWHVLKQAVSTHQDADFITHGGDFVNWGGSPYAWELMLDGMDEYLFNYPMMPTTGNHEDYMHYGYYNVLADNIFNIDCAESGVENGLLYSFDYGPIHFVVMRSNDAINGLIGNKISDEQIEWLKADLAEANENPNIKWKIGMMHELAFRPHHNKNSGNYNTDVTGPQLLPIFTKYGLDLVIGGHSHYSNYTYPLIWDKTAPEYETGLRSDPDTVYKMGIYMRSVASLGENAIYKGDSVRTFNYTDTTHRGTIFWEMSTSGSQVKSLYEWDMEMAANLQNLYFEMFNGGIGYTPYNPKRPLSMYGYIEVTEDKLVLREYGVDYMQMYTATESEYADHAYFLDGFMLTK